MYLKVIVVLETNCVYNMDCFDGMKLIEDHTVDMILCDLPYGKTKCDWDIQLPLDKLWYEFERVIKTNGNIIFTCKQPFTSQIVISNPDLFKYELIWEKERPTNFLLGNKRVLTYHENILVFYKKLGTYNPQKLPKEKRNMRNNKKQKLTNSQWGTKLNDNSERVLAGMNTEIYPKSILKYNMEFGLHPTQKPINLIEYLIKTYTNINDIVLDPTMGSGTTAIACQNLNRKYIGFENNLKYYEIIKDRIKNNKLKINA
jgi:site-specific DNA-methyltransferase (adenine-specific)